MTPRLTRLNLSALTLVAWALLLGVLVGRPEPFLTTVPVLVALACARLRMDARDVVITHEVSADRLFEGDRLTVTVWITAGGPIPLIELREALPSVVALETGHRRAVFTLDKGEEVRWRFEVRCLARQELSFGHVRFRVWDRQGLHLLEAEHREAKRVMVYPRSVPLRRLPRPRQTQTSVGNYVSPTFGEGLEPGEIRPFVPGDRVRHVNWRASLRLGELYVTHYHQERNADVVLMLDTLAAAGPRGTTSLDLCVRAAASIASAYLARKDRVGLIDYGGMLRWVGPGSGRAQHARIMDSLLRAEVIFTYVAKDLALVPPRILPPQALIIALSPFLDARFVKAATDLAARGLDVVVVAVSPVELTRAAVAPSPVVDVACRLWALEWRARLGELRRQGLMVVEWRAGEPLESALAVFGRHRHRVAVAGR